MITVVLQDGTEVVYRDNKTVCLRSDNTTLTNLVIGFAQLLALVGAHFEILSRRQRGDTKNDTLALGSHPLGLYIQALIAAYRQKFGDELHLPHQISFRPGTENRVKKVLQLIPTEAPTKVLRLDSLFALKLVNGEPLIIPDAVWNELFFALAVEFLGPMMRKVKVGDKLNRGLAKATGGKMVYDLHSYNSTLMRVTWFLFAPLRILVSAWRKAELFRTAEVVGTKLEEAVLALSGRVDTLLQTAAENRTALEDERRSLDEESDRLATERDRLKAEALAIDARRKEVNSALQDAATTHQQALDRLKESLREMQEAKEQLELQALGRDDEIARLKLRIENYEVALRDLPK